MGNRNSIGGRGEEASPRQTGRGGRAPARLVVIGGSKGAFRALGAMLGALPATFPLPVVIVVHRMADAGSRLAEVFQNSCALPVVEPEDKQPVRGGVIWLAPADYHLLIERRHFALSTDPPVNYSRPSIDVLFESAADAYGASVLGILLTGSSTDGAAGLARIRRAGGETLVENPGSSDAAVMPAAAVARQAADRVLRLGDLARYLHNLGGGKDD